MRLNDFWIHSQHTTLRNHLEGPLKKWIATNKDYSELSNGDHLYWYNEIATLSTFAGALWKSGATVLQEFRETKGQRRGKWEGRVDLWFKCKNTHYLVEAKQLWVSLAPNANDPIDTINSNLKFANEDAIESWKANKECNSLGITFVVPYLKSTHASDFLEEKVKLFISGIENGIENIDAYAYVFPKSKSPIIPTKNYLYPGVAMLISLPETP
jgi:hypothetical protein